MRKGSLALCMRRTAVLAFATVAVAASAALAVPASAMAADSVGSACYYKSKDGMALPIVGTFTSVDDLLSKGLSIAKDSGTYKVVFTLNADWNTRNYGMIDIPEGSNVEFRLNGHMLDRDLADSTYYGTGSGEVFRVRKNATLSVDGGGMDHYHKGTLSHDGRFWESSSNGSDLIFGGLIAGGANDTLDAAGGISLYGENSKAFLKNVTLAGNVADTLLGVHGLGGGVYLHGDNSYLELDCAKVVYNHAELSGGGIYADGKNATVVAKNGSSVSSNSAEQFGGGISHDAKGGSVTFTDSAIANNITNGTGAGIYDTGAGTAYALENSSISKNVNTGTYSWMVADLRGDAGGVYLGDTATFSMAKGSKISSNSARIAAGISMEEEDSHLIMDGVSMIENNAAAEDAGGVYLMQDMQTVVMKGGSKICGNTAVNGAGVYIAYGGSMFDGNIRIQLEDSSSISDNTASQKGGGVYDEFSNKTHVYSNDKTGAISGNKANKGAGFYADRDAVHLTDISITGNSATKEHGGYYAAYHSGCTLKGTVKISGNYADGKKSDLAIINSYLLLDSSNYLTPASRIGLDVAGSGRSGKNVVWTVFSNKGQLDKLDSAYTTVFTCDDTYHKVVRQEDSLVVKEGYDFPSIDFDPSDLYPGGDYPGGADGISDEVIAKYMASTKVAGVKLASAKKGKVKVAWSTFAVKVDGFKVRCASSKAKLANNKGKVVKAKGAGKKTVTVKGLKSGKKRFFKVRAYKVIDGKTYYSAWSKVKAVKVK